MADIGHVGLAVMGENLALNIARNGFKIAVYNRTVQRVDDFVQGRGKSDNVIGCRSVEEFAGALKTPRIAILLVRAGDAVDATINGLVGHFQPGDIIIDGGNSHYPDSERRFQQLKEKGILFVGSGVSGGEEGALNGPSIMPGGAPEAWPIIKPILQKISAHSNGEPCCDWLSTGGSGHFVKMVHNGIEYGDMQLIAESYSLLKHIGLSNPEIGKVFEDWNKGVLDSYLIEITAEIMTKKDDQTDNFVLDVIVDSAGQKGTGKWTTSASLDVGMPLTLIGEAVFARFLSAQRDERKRASEVLQAPEASPLPSDRDTFIADIQNALYASKIVSYAQGFVLLRASEKMFGWKFNYGSIANMWRGGCIIRSAFLGNIRQAFSKNEELENLLLDEFFLGEVTKAQMGWRRVIAYAAMNGIATPAMSSALAYYDGYRTAAGPANLIQAQRDFFGAHTFERIDSEPGKAFHCNWTGRGGNTTSNAYDA